MKKMIYPFSVKSEKRTNGQGKEYSCICVSRSYKNKEGERKYENINLVDKKDLLLLAYTCFSAVDEIEKEEQEAFKSANTDQPSDEIPF